MKKIYNNEILKKEHDMSFEGRAKDWDNDSRIKRSKIVAEKINEIIGNKKYNSAMEYGCATGLISLNLYDKFKKLTLMDSEREMIKIVKDKVDKYKKSKVFPIQIDLMNEAYKAENFDLIYTSLTLHHIPDTKKIIKAFYNLLNENGMLCIIDLDKEDGSFHINQKDFNGHNGFEHRYMEDIFEDVGFLNIESNTFYKGEKIYKEKAIPYSLFYTVGYRR